MNTKHNFAGFVGLLIFLAISGGYVANIVRLVVSIGEPLTTTFILRVVGVFVPPLGAILGYV